MTEDSPNSREIAAVLQHLAELRVELARIRARTQNAIDEARSIRQAFDLGQEHPPADPGQQSPTPPAADGTAP